MTEYSVRRKSIEESAAARYDARRSQRDERQRNLERLGQGGDWRKVDDPRRVLNRLLSLGRSDLAAGAMDSVETREFAGATVPSFDILERLIQADDTLGSAFLFDAVCAARSVDRIIVRGPTGVVRGYGTGFLVSPDLLLTNHHVLSNEREAAGGSIEWDFYLRRDGAPASSYECALAPQRFFLASQQLDYALVAVEWPADEAKRRHVWLPLASESGKAIVGESVNIIQHPSGGPQKVALRANQIVDVFDSYLHYSTDTEPGSSGSPVLNDQWQLAALHHAGVPKLVDGRTTWVANEGIRISSIVAKLKEQAVAESLDRRRLLDIVLAGTAPTPCGCGGRSPARPAEHAEEQPPVANARPDRSTLHGPVVDSSGQATWVFPVRVSIDVGGPSRPGDSDRNVVVPKAPRPHEPVKDVSADTSPQLLQSLGALREAEAAVYYDATSDRQKAVAYYASVAPDASPAAFFQSLSRLLRETHTTQLSYTAARLDHLYPRVDLQESRRLHSVYSGKPIDAESLIREELAVQERHERLLREFVTRESTAATSDAIDEYLEQLEAEAPFNCEHVVPQSWFDKRNPMKSDLHHLFTCEPDCNSFRGNIPYFQFSDEVVREDCGRRETGKFEPQANKGAVARATLYFLLRYPRLVGNSSSELRSERLAILLDWHRASHPDKWEKHRNAEIFAVQGNRNPLIDNPAWADLIDFRLGFAG